MHPAVDVRGAAEIPDHVRAFELPVVPDAVVADVAFFVEDEAEVVEAVVKIKIALFLRYNFCKKILSG